MNETKLIDQLKKQRRTVDFDTFDITVQQLLSMLKKKNIDIAPAYQRKFRWEEQRCSQLIESILLGIPVPSVSMATNRDGSWELVDGVQRISAIVWFAGDDELRGNLKLTEPLTLVGLEKLTEFLGTKFADLPASVQLQFELRPLKVVTLSDKSDKVVRFDLFERLNKGGVALTEQEIRDCVYRGRFTKMLETLTRNHDFKTVLRLSKRQRRNGTNEECVLRFFAFLDNYGNFVHSVRDFLTDYTREASKNFDFPAGRAIFRETFAQLAVVFPDGLVRPTPGKKLSTTSLILYEGVAVGAALAIQKAGKIDGSNVQAWLSSPELLKFTRGATNDTTAVKGRIEFCRDRFLGVPTEEGNK